MGRVFTRLKELTRASPGELGVIAVLATMVLGGSALVYARTTDPPPPPITQAHHLAEVSEDQPKLLVHVAGAVVTPGVYDLDDGSRIRDAIAAAGGPVDGADINALNLAEKLSDGQKVVVPRVGEVLQAAGSPSEGGKINLNLATKAQLEELPSVGPVLAQRIIDHREKKGRFTSVRQLMEVEGFGPKKFEALKDLIAV